MRPLQPYPALTNDLRLRVLNKEDITAEEMLLIVQDIRQGRRNAARPDTSTKGRRAKSSTAPAEPEDLNILRDQLKASVLDQELS